MTKPSQWVDISKFPPDERPHIIELAEKHNALSEDVDKISGSTPEQKADMHHLFEVVRGGFHYLHTKRFNIGLLTLQMGAVVFILDKLGVDIKSLAPEIIKIIKALTI